VDKKTRKILWDATLSSLHITAYFMAAVLILIVVQAVTKDKFDIMPVMFVITLIALFISAFVDAKEKLTKEAWQATEFNVYRILNALAKHCGERGQAEDAVQTLERIILERNTMFARFQPLAQALAFYANEENYDKQGRPVLREEDLTGGGAPAAEVADNGALARAAMKEAQL
jgi:hypothetical protein